MINHTTIFEGYSSASASTTTTSTSTNENNPSRHSECSQYFQAKQNNIKVLMAMSVGLTYRDGTILNDFRNDPFPKEKRSQFIPGNQFLIEVILRREKVKGWSCQG